MQCKCSCRQKKDKDEKELNENCQEIGVYLKNLRGFACTCAQTKPPHQKGGKAFNNSAGTLFFALANKEATSRAAETAIAHAETAELTELCRLPRGAHHQKHGCLRHSSPLWHRMLASNIYFK